MAKKSVLDWIAYILVIIGAINWGLFGLFDFDVVYTIFGVGLIADIIYVLVGVAGLYILYKLFK